MSLFGIGWLEFKVNLSQYLIFKLDGNNIREYGFSKFNGL
jgi:hypothetical protein